MNVRLASHHNGKAGCRGSHFGGRNNSTDGGKLICIITNIIFKFVSNFNYSQISNYYFPKLINLNALIWNLC